MRIQRFWTAKRVETLTALWTNTSARLIAKKLGCTRNQVIGKAYRLGLPAICKSEKSKRCSVERKAAWRRPEVRARHIAAWTPERREAHGKLMRERLSA